MNRAAIAVVVAVAMALMSVPGQVTAHESTALDLNDAAYDNVWPLLGPGGATDNDAVRDGLSALGLHAQKGGGDPVYESCTHHDPGIVDEDDPYNANDQCEWQDDETEDNPNPDGAVHETVAFQCTGTKSFTSTEEADIVVDTPFPYKHSDLDNGIFEATGSFFVPLEITGDDADRVSQVWFGFMHTFAWPMSSALCQDAFPLPGAYYEFYRGDTDGSDGWEIPVNTLLVPDAPYGAVLRFLDSSGNTLAATFVFSNVNNYLNDAEWQPGTPTSCDQEGDTGGTLCPYHDTTPPRATVFIDHEHSSAFPRNDDIDNADGTTDTPCKEGVALEYGEPLADDGTGEPAVELTSGSGDPVDTDFEYNPPDRDVDSVPIETTARDNWGPGICVEEPPGTLHVKAWDQSGNIGSQTIDTTR